MQKDIYIGTQISNKKNKPLVSICIPTYNGESYIKEAIKSALAQTYHPIEIVISDDESIDNTIKIANSILKDSAVPFAIYNHTKSGIGNNWNNCIKKSNGEYVKFLFQDDFLEPDCVTKMMSLALQCDKIGLVFSRRKIIFNETNQDHLLFIQKHGNLHTSFKDLKLINRGALLLKNKKILKSPLNKVGEPTATLISKEVIKEVGYFNSNLKQTLDYEYWYRIFKKFKIAFIDEELVSFRLHSMQATNINKNNNISEERYIEENLFYRKLFYYLDLEIRIELLMKYNFWIKFFFSLTRSIKKKVNI